MRLYHFIGERYGLEAIRDSRLKLARLSGLNDPFEFLLVAQSRNVRRAFNGFKKDFDRKYGLLCMTEGWQHPLLWAHYAESHHGLCLGFDASDEIFSPVTYVPKRLTLEELGLTRLDDMDVPQMKRVLNTKFKAWEYERERRAFAGLTDKDPVSGIYFADFGDHLRLREVIVGERSTLTYKKLVDVIGERHSGLTTMKARAAFKTFEMVPNRLKRVWPQ